MEVAHLLALQDNINVTGRSELSSVPSFLTRTLHYQRLVRMGSDHSDGNRTILFADPPGSSTYVYQEVPVAKLNEEVMDVAFVKLVDTFNFPGGLRALVRDHRFDEHGVNLGDHWKHKYLVDIDGMGYSGRFFSFLESDSAVLKASVYREFFGEWIQPWFVWHQDRNVLTGFLTAAAI